MTVPVTRIRKSLILAIAIGLLLVAAAAVVIHLPVVQEAVWKRVTDEIHEKTGWRIGADSVRMRMWPARLELSEISVGTGDMPMVQVDRVALRFRWRRIATRPHRLDVIEIEGPRVDLEQLQLPDTSNTPEPSTAADPWTTMVAAHRDRWISGRGRRIPGWSATHRSVGWRHS